MVAFYGFRLGPGRCGGGEKEILGLSISTKVYYRSYDCMVSAIEQKNCQTLI